VSSVATSPATATISDVSFATPDRKDSPHHPAISPETRERARRARAAYTRRGKGGGTGSDQPSPAPKSSSAQDTNPPATWAAGGEYSGITPNSNA
jgi:hypothetical protein